MKQSYYIDLKILYTFDFIYITQSHYNNLNIIYILYIWEIVKLITYSDLYYIYIIYCSLIL